MNLQGIIRILILIFALTLAACGTEAQSYRVQGDVWGFCQGMRTQLSGTDVYVFHQDQVQPFFENRKTDSIAIKASAVFDRLPYAAAKAHTVSGPYSGYFALSLSEPGNYFIVAKCADYRYGKAGKPPYWLLPFSVTDRGITRIDLDEKNTVDTITTGNFSLEVD